ncbi:replication restart helicase PriA [Bergeyella zoohelcum]|uniref:Replication restart protein PriA n=1 Tax=Bergeyella zoohelcum TaxID=1015 RepID=A0A7Z9CH99_9FLAO|nr:primosomal protein N' [Bergeyella zoohelcum]VDH04609.1 primosome assembly protein PriA [Bergeyella zoohelcum]
MELFAEVVLPLPMKGTFTYEVPVQERSAIQRGCRVLVPFGGKKIYTGIVFALHNNAPTEYHAKAILSVLDQQPILSAQHLNFWQWLSEYYLCSLGEIYRFSFPSSLKLESETYVSLKPGAEIDHQNLDANELYLIQNLEVRQLVSLKEMEAFIPRKNIVETVKSLIDLQYIVIDEKVIEQYNAKEVKYIRLKNRAQVFSDLPAILAQLKKAPKQKEILLYLVDYETENPTLPLKKSMLHQQIVFSQTQLNALVDKKWVEEFTMQESRLGQYEGDTEILDQLTDEQQHAFSQINTAFGQNQNVLLHGVTSSGKTHIYAEKIQEVLEHGKTALYLVPEISLAKHILLRLEKKYGKAIVSYHSKLTDFEKVEIWQKILKGEIKVVIGTRAALFLPLSHLGLIVVDEEHDANYRPREVQPYFNAKDAAIVLGKIMNAPVILGSATPSLESYYLAQKGKMAMVSLKKRFGEVELPKFYIQSIKEFQEQKKMVGNFTALTLEYIDQAVKHHKQVMVLHNKRGYSSVIECETCGFVSYCSNCDVVMTYHKTAHELKCHYCGHRAVRPTECPKCSSKNLNSKGIGVEKIHEELQSVFSDFVIDRMDIDAMRKKFAYERLYEKIENGETQIIVGTQMMSKGLDFDAVDLVVIPRADHLLYFQDFRAEERAYQLIHQVAGRAGRSSGQGKIIIQALNPQHQVFITAQHQDNHSVYQYLLDERKKFNYPPFTRLILVEFKHRNEDKVRKAMDFLAHILRNHIPEPCIFGPSKSPIPKLNLMYQYQILLKLPKNKFVEMKKHLEYALEELDSIDAYKSVKKYVLVDY